MLKMNSTFIIATNLFVYLFVFDVTRAIEIVQSEELASDLNSEIE